MWGRPPPSPRGWGRGSKAERAVGGWGWGGSRGISVEVMGKDAGAERGQRADATDTDRDDAVLVLEGPLGQQERLVDDNRALALEERGADDRVGDAGLVLQREEHE